jgi:alpha-1,3-glucan synthase
MVTTVLWISQHASPWQILLLCVAFFGFAWIVVLFLLARLSKSHSWILPVLACGLGAPRWAQIWWGTSGSGLFLPWAGSYTSGALVSRSLWLWLGILDALQGLGFGMILLQTLTRMHICFTLLVSQVLGSIATICARAFAPNNIGPGPISPDITAGAGALGNAWFWVALLLQLSIWYVLPPTKNLSYCEHHLTFKFQWWLSSFLPKGAVIEALNRCGIFFCWKWVEWIQAAMSFQFSLHW